MSHGSSSRKKTTSMDEVEELLRSAQDDILLKLSINSHIAHSGPFSQTSSSTIDPDLDRRFEALKSKRKPKLSTTTITRTEIDKKNPEKEFVDIDESGDDLFARFAALKNSIPSYSSSSSVGVDKKINNWEKFESADEEDEVEKVLNWAIDAARLDPSPPSDADTVDDSEKDSDSENDSDDEDNHKVDKKKK